MWDIGDVKIMLLFLTSTKVDSSTPFRHFDGRFHCLHANVPDAHDFCVLITHPAGSPPEPGISTRFSSLVFAQPSVTSRRSILGD